MTEEQFHTTELPIERFRKRFKIDPRFAKTLEIKALDQATYELLVSVCCHKFDDYKNIKFKKPKNWWEHFKEEKFPKWLLKRFSVKYKEEVRTVHMKHLRAYPEIELPKEFSDKYIIHEQITEDER